MIANDPNVASVERVAAVLGDQSVEQPAIGLFAVPGWQILSALEETSR